MKKYYLLTLTLLSTTILIASNKEKVQLLTPNYQNNVNIVNNILENHTDNNINFAQLLLSEEPKNAILNYIKKHNIDTSFEKLSHEQKEFYLTQIKNQAIKNYRREFIDKVNSSICNCSDNRNNKNIISSNYICKVTTAACFSLAGFTLLLPFESNYFKGLDMNLSEETGSAFVITMLGTATSTGLAWLYAHWQNKKIRAKFKQIAEQNKYNKTLYDIYEKYKYYSN